MTRKGMSLKDFGHLSPEEQSRMLLELAELSQGASLTESLQRLRKQLDDLELQHRMTTEDMIGSRACNEIEEDAKLNRWATLYACYRQLLENYRAGHAESVA